jgi:predicted dehydrogenase
MHEAAIVQAAARGLHVLCEKPLTISAGAWRQITAAAAAAGILVFPVHNWKCAPHFQLLKTLITAETIGKPTHIELVTLRRQPAGSNGWRLDPKIAGGGILLDHGWHAFYLLLFLLGALPQQLVARTEKRHLLQADVEDTVTCEIWFPHTRAYLHLTWASAQRCTRVMVRGERGMLCLEDRQLVVHTEGNESYTIPFSSALSASSYHPDWFAALLPAFRDAISGPGPYEAYLHEPQLCLHMTLHAYRSAAGDGQPLTLTEDTDPEEI